MAILPIYLYGSEVLKKKTKQISDIKDRHIQLIMNMNETMKNANGLGLSANQVGVSESLFVLDVSHASTEKDEKDGFYIPLEFRKPFILFNPEIVKSWDEFTMEEGCLSIPEIRAEVTRPDFIRVRFRDGDFKNQTIEVDGLLSRVIQHELDHLNGHLFVERLGKVKINLMKKKLKKIQSCETEANYPIVVK